MVTGERFTIMFKDLKTINEIIRYISMRFRNYIGNPNDTRKWGQVETDVMMEVIEAFKTKEKEFK